VLPTRLRDPRLHRQLVYKHNRNQGNILEPIIQYLIFL